MEKKNPFGFHNYDNRGKLFSKLSRRHLLSDNNYLGKKAANSLEVKKKTTQVAINSFTANKCPSDSNFIHDMLPFSLSIFLYPLHSGIQNCPGTSTCSFQLRLLHALKGRASEGTIQPSEQRTAINTNPSQTTSNSSDTHARSALSPQITPFCTFHSSFLSHKRSITLKLFQVTLDLEDLSLGH